MRKKNLKVTLGIPVLMITMGMYLCQPKQLGAADVESADTWISTEYQAYCEEIAKGCHLSPEFLMAVIERESWGVASVYNGNCKGLMQINEPYHRDRMERLGVTDIYDPYGNILVGADYLMELFQEYQDPGTVLMIYNGSSNAEERGANADYTEYAECILMRTQELERLHGK